MSHSQSESQSQSGSHQEERTISGGCRRAPGRSERSTNKDSTSGRGGSLEAAPPPHPDLSQRLALTVEEAAAAIGVSERHFRSMMSDIPHVRLGTRVLVPLDLLREWLRGRAETSGSRVDRTVDEIVRDFNQ